MARHVPTAQWYLALNTAANSTAYPTAATEGIAVPGGKVNEWAHVAVESNAGCVVRVLGLTSAKNSADTDSIGQRWVKLEEYSTAGDVNYPYAEPIRGVTAYTRLAVQRIDQNANAVVNAYLGLCEHWRGC
jgi:hypothetical protein